MVDDMNTRASIEAELERLIHSDSDRAYLSGICVGIASRTGKDNFALLARAIRLLRDGYGLPQTMDIILDRQG